MPNACAGYANYDKTTQGERHEKASETIASEAFII